MTLRIHTLPALDDNYIFALEKKGFCVIIDPAKAKPILTFLFQNSLTLAGIIVTHHHFDHIGGVAELVNTFKCPVYGPKDPRLAFVTTPLEPDIEFSIKDMVLLPIATPGHTSSHMSFYCHEANALFSGDTLFGCGCGRIFDGTAIQMYNSFVRLGSIPPDTWVYCAHEYTQDNIAFAKTIDPSNILLVQRGKTVLALRNKKIPSVPFLLSDDFATNPFFRTSSFTLRASLGFTHTNPPDSVVFATLRNMKDLF